MNRANFTVKITIFAQNNSKNLISTNYEYKNASPRLLHGCAFR